jgi:exocyst complex protein 7
VKMMSLIDYLMITPTQYHSFFNAFISFQAFNREMDEIARLQQAYAVPDAELRARLQRASRDYIIPKYKEFYDKYSGVSFTKNSDKYIKYTPASVTDIIDNFFDVA